MGGAETMERLAQEWRAACDAKPCDVTARDRALAAAHRLLGNRGERDYGWFANAFDDPERCWFALAVIYGNLPRKLLRPVLEAACRHPDVSSNKYFVRTAVAGYSADEVNAILRARLDATVGYEARSGIRAALYWVYKEAADIARARIQRRANKLSPEQRLRWFLDGDLQVQHVLVWFPPLTSSDPAPELRPLVDEVLALAARQADRYVLSCLRDHGYRM